MKNNNFLTSCVFLILLIAGQFSVFPQNVKNAAIISVKNDLGEHGGDSALRDKLVALGFEVTSYRDGDFDSGKVERADYESNDLIVASESSSASKLRTILRFGFSVPTINMEVASVRNSHHALELISTVSTGNGWHPTTSDNAYKLKILNGEHSLAAGLSTGQVIDLVSNPNCIDDDPFATGYIGWMVDEIGLIPVASLNEPGGDTSLVIAGIEKGTLNMHGDTINARYVQFNVNSFTPTAWTAETDNLFEAAINWVMDSPTSVENQELSETPVNFSLSQNYPNPFNPSTKIEYSVPRQSNVVLEIFDVLGSEVAALVNESQPQGYYEINFDASNLTNGIYFYRIQADNFINTKKMLLIK